MERILNYKMFESEAQVETPETPEIDEARSWYSLNDNTEEMYNAFQRSAEGGDLQAIGVDEYERRSYEIVLERRGGPMAKVAIFKNREGEYCYEYLSSKEGVERYNLSKFDTPEKCLRALLLRIIRNNIPAAIIPKKDIPSLNFTELVPIGAGLSMQQILARMKEVIGGHELSDLDVTAVVALPTIQNLDEMGLVGKGARNDRTIINKVDIISPKYRFYSRAAQRVGEIYGDMLADILSVKKNELGGIMFNTTYEVWRVNNSNRRPLNSVNFRTGDNSVVCNIQDNEIFGSVFIAIFKRTFKRAKGKYEKEHLIEPTYNIRTDRDQKVELITELNSLLSDYFTIGAESLDASIFIEPGEENSAIHNNSKALLIKYLLSKGSVALKGVIAENDNLQDLVDLTTKREDVDALTKQLIKVSRALRYV
jgi:hypothetical protein